MGTKSTIAERLDAGRAKRKTVPRSAHAEWSPPADRHDPLATLQATDDDRLPELLPIRYGRMAANPFAFLRGSAAVMNRDLAGLPTTGDVVQTCGDCHLLNFGLFATPERNVVFGLNDFDETLPGPWEYDVKRLAVSFVVAAHDVGLDDTQARAAAAHVVRSYREHVWRHVDQSPLDIWYDRISLEEEIVTAPDARSRRRRERLMEKARQRVGEQLYPRLARDDGDRLVLVDQPPLLFHPQLDDAAQRATAFLERYRESLPTDRRVLFDRYEFRDSAMKVVGVGSVGTRCLVALMTSQDAHPLLLQVKEARRSVLEPFVGDGGFTHQGERVVVGQRLMQPASDIFLGWSTGHEGRQFYVRQLRDMKLSIPLVPEPAAFLAYGGYCGRALARAHANSGDPVVIAGYLGRSTRFDDAVAAFALAYASQNELDHAALRQAIDDGRIDIIDETI